MGQTDIQYKDQLRKDLIDYELIVELIKGGNTEKAVELLDKHISRIKSSLED
jgi:DNA-binding GntR family transcriptional regulator